MCCDVIELPVEVSACVERNRSLFNITLWSVCGAGGCVQGLLNQKSSNCSKLWKVKRWGRRKREGKVSKGSRSQDWKLAVRELGG